MLFPPYIISSQRQLEQEQLGLPALLFRQVAIKLSPLTAKLRREEKNRAKANHTCQKFASQLSFRCPKGGSPVVNSISEGMYLVWDVTLKIKHISWHIHCIGQNVNPKSIFFHLRFVN